MKKTAWVFIVILCFMFAFPMFGWSWSASSDAQGNWYVRNGRLDAPSTVKIDTANEKSARKLAKKLNKTTKKAEKKEGKGFKDDGDCPPGLRC